MDFNTLSDGEKEAFRKGQEIAVDEMLNAIAELEKTRNPASTYGMGQLFILRELVRKITEE
jgi:hypothetical protein